MAHHSVVHEPLRSEEVLGPWPEVEGASVDEDHHGQGFVTRQQWCVDVHHQAVLLADYLLL